MINLASAMANGDPIEGSLTGSVLTNPTYYYGTRTHAEHEAFYVESEGQRIEVVENLGLCQNIPVQAGDAVEMHGEFVPHGSHGPLMHWIHRDPSGRHESGFLTDDGVTYD